MLASLHAKPVPVLLLLMRYFVYPHTHGFPVCTTRAHTPQAAPKILKDTMCLITLNPTPKKANAAPKSPCPPTFRCTVTLNPSPKTLQAAPKILEDIVCTVTLNPSLKTLQAAPII